MHKCGSIGSYFYHNGELATKAEYEKIGRWEELGLKDYALSKIFA